MLLIIVSNNSGSVGWGTELTPFCNPL